jgi:hypothetical protein
MDPAASLREAGADIPAKSTEQPEDEQNYDDGPQHEISPFRTNYKSMVMVKSGLSEYSPIVNAGTD